MPNPRDGSRKERTEPRVCDPLPLGVLRWRCDPESLPFRSTEEVEPVTGVVGQDAAFEALRFGLETDAPGQNIFVRGLSGTGRLTLVRRLLEEIRPVCPRTRDYCYVHNFLEAARPRLITLPAGQGPAFRRRVDKLADFVRDNLGIALNSESINARRAVLDHRAQRQLREVVAPFEESLQASGLTLVNVEAGPVVQSAVFPLVDGNAVAPEEFDQLHAQGEIADAHYKAVRERYGQFQEQLAEINDKANDIRETHQAAVAELLEKEARTVLMRIVRTIEAAFPQPAVRTFLGGVVEDVVTRRLAQPAEQGDFTRLYRVNVLLEHTSENACPIIAENVPTVRNLLGTIDFDPGTDQEIRADHLGIRAGALLRADGGYLILEDRDILDEPDAWKVLMRVLRSGCLEITPPESGPPGWAPSLKPEPIEIQVKVVMLGDPDTYAALDANDPNFPQLFRVLADFDDVIPRDDAGVGHYAAVFARIVAEEQLPAFDRTAVAALTEHGARIAARAGKLTARFGRLADIAREAAFIRRQKNHAPVTGDDVREAVRRGRQRADLPSRRFRELVADRTIRVETQGSVVGQINGLAVLQAGPITYGFPTRITATIGPGTAGVINIDREAALSGAIHTKGFYILNGLLRFLLRTNHPLAFDASVAFEQTYGAIDGDSASGAEICCLISALTDIPLRQGVAMTGAIDQLGHILAVGAVNEKVEGFFDACHDLELTGRQGVIIPKANTGDLMLRADLVEACGAGRFHIYAVDTVHQALEVLTGMPPGCRSRRGRYRKGTVLGAAVERAREYWRQAAQSSSASDHAGPTAPSVKRTGISESTLADEGGQLSRTT